MTSVVPSTKVYAEHLQSNLPSLILGKNLFAGPMRPFDKQIPQLAVFVLGNAGTTPQMLKNQEEITNEEIHVFIRSAPEQYEQGEQLAYDVYYAIHRNQPTQFVDAVGIGSRPKYLGTDDQKCHRWSAVFETQRSFGVGAVGAGVDPNRVDGDLSQRLPAPDVIAGHFGSTEASRGTRLSLAALAHGQLLGRIHDTVGGVDAATLSVSHAQTADIATTAGTAAVANTLVSNGVTEGIYFSDGEVAELTLQNHGVISLTKRKMILVDEHFFATTTPAGWQSISASPAQEPSEAGHYGIISHTFVGSGSGRGIFLSTATVTNQPLRLDGIYDFRNTWTMKITNPTTGQNHAVYVGFIDSVNTNGITSGVDNGCYFFFDTSINTTKWLIACENNGVRTIKETTIDFMSGWHNFSIVVMGDRSAAFFFVDGTLVDSITTNIPISTRPFTVGIVGGKFTTTGTGTTKALIDRCILVALPRSTS